MSQSDVDRALAVLRDAVRQLESAGSMTAIELRARLTTLASRVLDIMEDDGGGPDDVLGRLDRQAHDIADDLRRAERLMRERMGQRDE